MSKKHVRCSSCSSLSTQRWGVRKTATGPIQRFRCLSCGTSFTCKVLSRTRVTPATQVELTRRHLEDRTAIRELVRDTGRSSTTAVEAIHAVTKKVVSDAWIANHFHPRWGGYLAVDGTSVKAWDWSVGKYRFSRRQQRWLHKMSLLVAQDTLTTDLPAHHLDVEEGSIELVTLFRSLQEIGYPLQGVVSDGNEEIPKAARLVFGPHIPHQLCQLHYLKNLRERVRVGTLLESQYREAKKKLPQGKRPSFPVPEELFTYLTHPGLPRTNQQLEVANRFLKLRLKTMGTFHSWRTATWYCHALVAYRRFLPYTDRKEGRENKKAPLELAGCDIVGWDYLTATKTNRQLKR